MSLRTACALLCLPFDSSRSSLLIEKLECGALLRSCCVQARCSNPVFTRRPAHSRFIRVAARYASTLQVPSASEWLMLYAFIAWPSALKLLNFSFITLLLFGPCSSFSIANACKFVLIVVMPNIVPLCASGFDAAS